MRAGVLVVSKLDIIMADSDLITAGTVTVNMSLAEHGLLEMHNP